MERPVPDRMFLGVAALLFIASAAATIVWCSSMSAMNGMPMPGGWTMSMTWMRTPEQTWAVVAGRFLRMWLVMMIAMMLPSLAPMLWRYRQALGHRSEAALGSMTALIAVAYFTVWVGVGMTVFPLGVALTATAMQHPVLARGVPIGVAGVVLLGGALQCTAWKTRQLIDWACAEPGAGCRTVGAATSLRHGLQLGVRCCRCCANLTVILLVIGVMDLRAMGAVTAAISIERIAPISLRAQRAIGVVLLGAGLFLSSRTLASG